MTDDPKPHRRRARYRGTHPRRFEEKYKELAPDLHPELVAHVRARGRTPAGQHVPILVDEVLAALAPRPGERGVDATLGFGGHAERLLEALSPGGVLLGLDVDPEELARTEARLRSRGHDENALIARRTNFAGLRAALDGLGWSDGADFVLADLGVSSMQLDDPARGFTYKHDGPLDMRMNRSRGPTAAQWLARASQDEIERALAENSDEPNARSIACALCSAPAEPGERRSDRRDPPIATTLALANAVRTAVADHVDEDDAELCVRRTFQALRIEVNDELGALDAFLRALPSCLRPGGRVALLAFHSGEDRRVKKALERGSREGMWCDVAPGVIRASPAEQRANPRSAPAKLRCARRAP